MQTTVRMTRGGQVVIPIELRDAMGLKPGDLIEIDVIRKVIPVAEQGNGEGFPVLA
jgi:AbrB family looped-hinge helix DNA binding protein